MSTDPTAEPSPSTRGGWCCLLFAALPLVWFVAVLIQPEWAFWYPVWVGAVVWNGADGHGGISHLFG
ncbi:hypothetical protein AB4039_29495 [Streptomyces sp. M-16]|uniref:hypothetical protein n=1 Tax=Streptomyces sp. M-16 TaxID=3233040 RepID=UPI00225348A5